MFDLWLLLQLAPLLSLGFNNMVLNFLEDVLLHTFPLPPLLIKSSYKKLYNAFTEHATSILDEAERLGIDRDEACHNLVFLAGFNAYGGMKATLPILIKWVGSGGEDLHRRLAREIRSTVGSEGGVTLAALDRMSLTKSVVYEALRIDPPVPFQYGRARRDTVVRSHDAAFEIKKGEMVFGYQPFATKDPRVFDDPEEFVGDRFVGEGEKLLRYVYWSNGRETDDPTVGNKQCAGKDLVLLVCRVTLVELFLRYDTFDVECGSLPVGSSVTFKSLTKAAITLRPSDVDDFLSWAADDRVALYLRWDSVASLEASESYLRAVTIPHLWRRSIYIGDRSMRYVSVKLRSGVKQCRARVGYIVGAKFWGRGFVTVRASPLSHKMRGSPPQSPQQHQQSQQHSIDTVNAAATAIVATEARAQPAAVQIGATKSQIGKVNGGIAVIYQHQRQRLSSFLGPVLSPRRLI
ncbi:hypothetical protein NL676_038621 [Syzygium grande]|nr:hypothetical protein NL676_038621 [Syzygium grande]